VNVLAVSAHPDDETLGCGGTLLRHRAGGDRLDWVIASDAAPTRWPRQLIDQKAIQIERVAQAYGVTQLTRLGWPVGRLDTVSIEELMEGVADAVSQARPDVVYLIHPGDAHTDHGAVFHAAMSVLKPFQMRKLGVRRVLAYETLSSTEASAAPSFVPNVYADISEFIGRKLDIMALYATEVQPEPYPRAASAIRALARFRGATVAVEYAEAFALVRELI
jgi:LmbE family N-acetylglucosaminyl deacetylase